MRYAFLFLAVFVLSCDSGQVPVKESTEPIVGDWVIEVPSQGAIVKTENFEIWSIRGNMTFGRQEPYGEGGCRGSNGVWELGAQNQARITLYNGTKMDSTMTISYQIEGDEMRVEDLGTGAKTIWRRVTEPPLLVMMDRGYCMGE